MVQTVYWKSGTGSELGTVFKKTAGGEKRKEGRRGYGGVGVVTGGQGRGVRGGWVH